MLDLAGTADYKILSAKVISQGSSQSFSQTLTIDAGINSGVRRNMTVICDSG
jgi:rod shape-determining protein MreC